MGVVHTLGDNLVSRIRGLVQSGRGGRGEESVEDTVQIEGSDEVDIQGF